MAGQTRSLSINFGIVLPPEPMLWDGNLATDKSLKSCNGAAMNEDKPVVFVVDDDPSVREALDSLVRSIKLSVQTFGSAEEFLNFKRPDVPGCIVLDVRLPGLNGLDFQHELTKSNVALPIVFIT